jgi:PPOX class probable F420-dependent enzyme
VVHLNPEQRVFVTERHLATLTTLREDGSPHVAPVAFTWDDDAGCARVTTNRHSVKTQNAARRGLHGESARAAICQVDGGRWITLEGAATVVTDLAEIVDAVARYGRRYRPLEPNPDRVVLRIVVDKVMSSTYMAE